MLFLLSYISHRDISGVKIPHISVIIYIAIKKKIAFFNHVFTLYFTTKKDQASTYFH